MTHATDEGQDNDDNGSQAGGSGTAMSSPAIALGMGETDNTLLKGNERHIQGL